MLLVPFLFCPLTVRISPFRQVLGQPGFELWAKPDLLLPCGQAGHAPLCRGPGAGRGWAESVSAADCPGQPLPQRERAYLYLQVRGLSRRGGSSWDPPVVPLVSELLRKQTAFILAQKSGFIRLI